MLTIPQNPSIGDTIQVDNRFWEWDGSVWKSLPVYSVNVSINGGTLTNVVIENSVLNSPTIDNPTFTNTVIDAGRF